MLDKLWPPSFKGAIFDFDGTLAESAGVWNEVDKIFLERRGLEWTPDFAPKIAALGFVDGAKFVVDEYGFDDTPEDICKEWNDLASALYPTQVHLRPGAKEYVDKLKENNIPVALATTNDNEVLGSLRPRIDVWDMFDTVVVGSDVTRTKHHPDIYLEAASRLHVEPCDCIVFEDILPGINSAKRAGMTAVGLATFDPTQVPEQIKQAADIFVEDWRHINI